MFFAVCQLSDSTLQLPLVGPGQGATSTAAGNSDASRKVIWRAPYSLAITYLLARSSNVIDAVAADTSEDPANASVVHAIRAE